MDDRPVLTLFGLTYCHLCAEMQLALERLQHSLSFCLELVDIEGNEELERRFGEKVPVLFCAEHEVCHYFLDEAALSEKLAEVRRRG